MLKRLLLVAALAAVAPACSHQAPPPQAPVAVATSISFMVPDGWVAPAVANQDPGFVRLFRAGGHGRIIMVALKNEGVPARVALRLLVIQMLRDGWQVSPPIGSATLDRLSFTMEREDAMLVGKGMVLLAVPNAPNITVAAIGAWPLADADRCEKDFDALVNSVRGK